MQGQLGSKKHWDQYNASFTHHAHHSYKAKSDVQVHDE